MKGEPSETKLRGKIQRTSQRGATCTTEPVSRSVGRWPPKGVPLKDIFKELTNIRALKHQRTHKHLGACLPGGRQCESPPASPLFLFLTPEAEPAQDVGGECETEAEEIPKKWGPLVLYHCGLYLETLKLGLDATRLFKPLKGIFFRHKTDRESYGTRQTHRRAGKEL